MAIRTVVDYLTSRDVLDLVAEHLAGMHGESPPGHVNALAVEELRAPDITFWTAWWDGHLSGCGALKELNATTGEIKSMRTRPAFIRKGIGQALLDEIMRAAEIRGYCQVYLETGTGPAFQAAHSLYAKNGFIRCAAFGDYKATEFNMFMVKNLRRSD